MLKTLEEVKKKYKFVDEVHEGLFVSNLFMNTMKLMEEEGCLYWKTSHFKNSMGEGTSQTPKSKISENMFLKNLKNKEPKVYRKLIKESLNPETGSQKEHTYLIKVTRQKLEKKGYEVYGGRDKKAVEKLRNLHGGYLVAVCQGKNRYPDLIAFKGEEHLFVEVASSKNRLIKQLIYNQMGGKTLLVSPVQIENLHLWGLYQLLGGEE